ncbi:MAG: hypothetical protein RMK52_10170, partial [Chitinophagales bacterium]|nr:hypothetical protein [Chitinophagales bacterium]
MKLKTPITRGSHFAPGKRKPTYSLPGFRHLCQSGHAGIKWLRQDKTTAFAYDGASYTSPIQARNSLPINDTVWTLSISYKNKIKKIFQTKILF